MLRWFFNLFKAAGEAITKPSEECRFLQNLCEAHPNVNKFYYSQWIGYMHEFIVLFPGIKVELKYNDIRGDWNMQIWNTKSNDFIYYHDCLNYAPWDAMSFMIERFDMMKTLNASLQKKKERKAKEREENLKLKQLYLSKSNGNQTDEASNKGN